uniref:Uncharacterized protein n=1 Tax=Plectus sambesii TaxID=2011161 RepID=A0A914VCM2_9BILA
MTADLSDSSSRCYCLSHDLPGHKAIAEGHAECLRAILSRPNSNSVRAVDSDQNTLLHAAAAYGRVEAIRLLLGHFDVSTHSKNRLSETAVLLAARNGKLECVQALLEGELRSALALALETDRAGQTVLMVAVLRNDNDMALWLLRRFGKALAVAANLEDVLPLHVAAGQGNIEFIRIATKYDIQMVNAKDRYGSTPAFYAIQSGYLQCLRYLVEKARADLRATNNRGHTLLHAACLSGQPHVVHYLLPRLDRSAIFWQTQDMATPVHCAAFGGHVEVLQQLFKVAHRNKKPLLSVRDRRGNSALHLTALNNHLYCASYLLEVGADYKLTNRSEQTAEDVARIRGHSEMCQLLSSTGKGKKKARSFFKSKKSPELQKSTSAAGASKSSGYGSGASRAMSAESRLSSPLAVQPCPEPSSGYASSMENGHQGCSDGYLRAKRASIDGRLDNDGRHLSREDQWQRRTTAKHAADDFLVAQSGDDDALDPPLTVPAPPRHSSLGAAFALVATSKDARRSFFDHACQTEPDLLVEGVQVVDDSADSQFRRAGIAAAEQIDRALLGETESHTSVTAAVVHRDPSPHKRLSRDENAGEPALHPPVLFDPDPLQDYLSCKELHEAVDEVAHAPNAQLSNSMLHLPSSQENSMRSVKEHQRAISNQKQPITTIQFNVQNRHMPLRGRSDRRNVHGDRRSVALPPSGNRFRYFGAANASVSDMRAYALQAAKKKELSQSLHSLCEEGGIQHGWHRPVWTANADGEEVLVQAVMY